MKGKYIVEEYWENILDIIIPNLPLLQNVTTKESTLGIILTFFFLI